MRRTLSRLVTGVAAGLVVVGTASPGATAQPALPAEVQQVVDQAAAGSAQ
ncbi:hypothetical protein G6019_04845, partial [Dietzia sp. DQ12-76]|nr:hypothetical protein [Dietzia sp. DQ12-76]